MMLCLITDNFLRSDVSGCGSVEAVGTAHAFKGTELCSKFGMNFTVF